MSPTQSAIENLIDITEQTLQDDRELEPKTLKGIATLITVAWQDLCFNDPAALRCKRNGLNKLHIVQNGELEGADAAEYLWSALGLLDHTYQSATNLRQPLRARAAAASSPSP